jgi:peroxiredoxin Q/BCP
MKLRIGNQAPAFSANDPEGHPVRLSDLKGQKIVLYFYPRDMTPGCTAEACSLRDNYRALLKQGYVILGVSTDDEKTHRKFIAKEKLPFRLLADPNKKLHAAYGTWVEKSLYGRTYMGTARVTFIIDASGVITDIIEKVDTKNHADQILKKEPSSAGLNPAKSAAKKTKAPTREKSKTVTKKVPAKKKK